MFIKKNSWQQDITYEEYVKAFCTGAGLLAAGAFLFYDTWVAAVLLSPLVIFFVRQWQMSECRKKELEFREQFKISIGAMSAALNVGYSVENAVRETARDIKPLFKKESRICREFERMIHELDINRPVEQVVAELAERVNQEDVNNFAAVFAAAKRTGGDSIEILRGAVKDISEKIEVEKEIQTLLSAKKLEFQVMCVIPLIILLYMRFAFPEFMRVLYGNPLGAFLMTICLFVYIAAYCMGKKIVEIEV